MRLTDLDKRALDQHGLITLTQSGLSRVGWYRALRSGRFEQVHPGVARLSGTPQTYRQRIAAAVLAVARPRPTAVQRALEPSRTGVLASHRSAASLWMGSTGHSTEAPDETPYPVDLILIDRRKSATLSDIVIHRPRDRSRLVPQTVNGIRCTNILRTLLDVGAVAPGGVDPLLGHALATKMVSIDAVATVLLEHARPGRSGVVALRAALDERAIDAKPADSVPEVAFARLIDRYELRAVEFHPRIEGWEVDFRFIGTRVLVECDGWTTHGLDRQPFERDRRRDADLTAAGWMVSRHTYRAITRDGAATARRLRTLLAASAR